MKKVLEMLERNVQWLAVGLGGLYVLWMAYTYLVTPPVSVKIGNESFSPGSVDNFIANGVVDELNAKMNDTRQVNLSAPQYVAAFKNDVSYAGAQVASTFLNPWVPVGLVEKVDVSAMPGPRPRPGQQAPVVTQLVAPPAATMLDFRVGNSNVDPNPPAQQEQPKNGGGPGIAQNPPHPPAVPGAAPGAPGNAPAGGEPVVPVVAVNGVDKTWVTVTFSVAGGGIAKSFQDMKLPAPLYENGTSFVEVELHRQEKLPSGQWGPDTIIKPLPINQLMPMPPAKSPVRMFAAFLDWANAHVKLILQPDFYTVLKGDPWGLPGEAVAQPIPDKPKETEKFDPSKYENATQEELMKLSPTERAQVAKWKADKKKKEQENRNKGKGGSGTKGGGGKGVGGAGGGLGGRGGGGPRGPNDDGRPPGGGTPGGERGSLSPSEDDRGQSPPRDANQQPAAGVGHPLPPGAFDPRQFGDIVGWAHDDTVVPGRVYHYRVVYRIKSPVWNSSVTKPPALAETFALTSADGEWGKEIDVPSLTSFYVVQSQSEKGSASVEVFRSQGGVPHGKKFDVAPGDVIGTTDGDVDFTTGWTMVDARNDLRTGDQYVIIMDPDGRLHRRDVNADRNNPDYLKAKQQIAGDTTPGDGRVATGVPAGAGDR